MSHAVFWDIDGTLLTTGRAGILAFEDAAWEICGVDNDLSKLRTAGLTDCEVARLVARASDADPAPETVAALLRAYERRLPARLHDRVGNVLPGVVDVLDAFSCRSDIDLLLLTGNTRAGARAKLSHYRLDGFFSDGAFCGDSDDRLAIARSAQALSGSSGHDTVTVVGDTPDDVRCGQAIGARTVAVASGDCSRTELEACGPWVTLEQLPTPDEFALLLGNGGDER